MTRSQSNKDAEGSGSGISGSGIGDVSRKTNEVHSGQGLSEAKVEEMIYKNPLLRTCANRIKQLEEEKGEWHKERRNMETKIDALINMIEREKNKRVETKMTMGQMMSYQERVITETRKKVRECEMEMFETRQNIREMFRDSRLGLMDSNTTTVVGNEEINQTMPANKTEFQTATASGGAFNITPQPIHIKRTTDTPLGQNGGMMVESNKKAKVTMYGNQQNGGFTTASSLLDRMAANECANVNWDSFFSQTSK